MSARPTLVAVGGVVLCLVAACRSGGDAPSGSPVPTGPPAVLAATPHMDGAVRLLARTGTGPGTVALPDTSGFPSLILTVTCPSDDTSTRLELEYADGPAGAAMGSDGCNAASYETPPLDPAHAPTAVRVTVARDAGYTVYVYGTQPQVTG